MRTEREKMLAGELYDASSAEIQADQLAAAEWMALQRLSCHAARASSRAMSPPATVVGNPARSRS
jgi:maltose O-acetyltransferase